MPRLPLQKQVGEEAPVWQLYYRHSLDGFIPFGEHLDLQLAVKMLLAYRDMGFKDDIKLFPADAEALASIRA